MTSSWAYPKALADCLILCKVICRSPISEVNYADRAYAIQRAELSECALCRSLARHNNVIIMPQFWTVSGKGNLQDLQLRVGK